MAWPPGRRVGLGPRTGVTAGPGATAIPPSPHSKIVRRLVYFLGAPVGGSRDVTSRAAALDLFRTDCMPETRERLPGMLVSALESGVGARRGAASETLTAIGLPALLPLTLRAPKGKEAAAGRLGLDLLGEAPVGSRPSTSHFCFSDYTRPGGQAPGARHPPPRLGGVPAAQGDSQLPPGPGEIAPRAA